MWGDIKTIKSGKISAPGSDISEKNSIVYESTFVKAASIGSTLSHAYSKNGSHSHSWNDSYHSFVY